MSGSEPRYPCPCCGFVTLGEPAGSFAICAICGWEDDLVQLRDPNRTGGANARSLRQAQEAGRWAAVDRDLMRGYMRARGWRPLEPSDGSASSVQASGSPYYWEQ
jgi:hypothetical protein